MTVIQNPETTISFHDAGSSPAAPALREAAERFFRADAALPQAEWLADVLAAEAIAAEERADRLTTVRDEAIEALMAADPDALPPADAALRAAALSRWAEC